MRTFHANLLDVCKRISSLIIRDMRPTHFLYTFFWNSMQKLVKHLYTLPKKSLCVLNFPYQPPYTRHTGEVSLINKRLGTLLDI